MEFPHWKTLADYFKQNFPACHKCQSHFQNREALLVHLTASHFKEEALIAFGDGPTCQMCNEQLAKHKESYRQYYILSHMAQHFEQLAPIQAKCSFRGPAEKNSTGETLSQNVFKPASTSVSPSMPSVEDSTKLKQEAISKLDIEVGGAEKKFIIPDETAIASVSKPQFCEGTKDESRENYWQECQALFESKYPGCKICKGYTEVPMWRRLRKMKRHLIRSHYSKEALTLFGKDNTCSICKGFSVKHCSLIKRHDQIKSHMVTHLEQFIPDERARNLFLKIDNIKGRAHIQILKKSITQAPNGDNTNINATQNHLGGMEIPPCHKFEAPKRACLSRPQFCEANQDASKENYWQECQAFFESKYPACIFCKGCTEIPIGQRLWKMKRHLIGSHYGKEALTLFGKANTCSICKGFSVKHGSRMCKRHDQIKSHMVTHLEQFILDERGRDLFLKIKAVARLHA